MKLRKEISKLNLLFISVGSIIGSGWLLGPLYSAKVAGPAAVLAWALGGFLMMLIGLTFAELSASIPVAGGMIRFAQFSHGRSASFIMSWVTWLAACIVAPIETLAAIQYISNYLPDLFDKSTSMLTGRGFLLAASTLALLCVVNFFAVKAFAKGNRFIASWKIIIPILVAIFIYLGRHNSYVFTGYGGFAPFGLKGVLSALPTAGVIFSFLGYSPAVQLAAEAKEPQKAIPFAIIGSITIAAIVYMVVELAFVGALTPDMLLSGWSHLNFTGDSGPVAGLVEGLGILWLLKLIYIDAIISPLGTANIYTVSTSRVNMAMSKNGFMPSFMTKLNSHGVPAAAIMVNFFVGLLFFLPFPGWQSMVSFIVSCFVLAYAIGPISCATLRMAQPDLHRPFKIPHYRLFCLIAFIVCNLIIYWTGWDTVYKMMILIGIGQALFIGLSLKHKQPMDVKRSFWIFPYLIGLAVISKLGDFGGGSGVIHFGPDFFVVALFSILIYMLAIYCAMTDKDFIFEQRENLQQAIEEHA